jgi:tetratricopeptide (TPR) repeat protein
MAWLRLVYHQIVYWIVGTTPEAHHANLANSLYELNRYRSCIQQCQKFLSYEDSDHIKAMMAYCYAALGDWEKAAGTYRSIEKIWSVPSFALGLAEPLL